MIKKAIVFLVRLVLSLAIGGLIVYPLFLYGRHFFVR